MVLDALAEIKAAILRQDGDVAENRRLIEDISRKLAEQRGGLAVLKWAATFLGVGSLAGLYSALKWLGANALR
jgi:hypothetical protein